MKRLLVVAALAAAPLALAAPASASAAPYCAGLYDNGSPQAAVCVLGDGCLVGVGGAIFSFGLCLP